jgi:hypothetical protein
VPLPPTALGAVSTRDWLGTPGVYLSAPFAVRVTNGIGVGVPGIDVAWRVLAGAGQFGSFPELRPDSGLSRTDSSGIARIFFQPGPSVSSKVTASVAGLFGSPVLFTVSTVPTVVIRFGAMFDCYPEPDPEDPSLFDEPKGPIPVGTVVEWIYGTWMHASCRARIVSRSVPAGAQPIDSGILAPGQSFRFLLNIAGDWVYEDVINGGQGVLSVR